MLINQNWISVRVNDDEARRAGRALISFMLKFYTTRFKLALKVTYICERVERIGVLVSAGIEG